jgi:hypothetical protein
LIFFINTSEILYSWWKYKYFKIGSIYRTFKIQAVFDNTLKEIGILSLGQIAILICMRLAKILKYS